MVIYDTIHTIYIYIYITICIHIYDIYTYIHIYISSSLCGSSSGVVWGVVGCRVWDRLGAHRVVDPYVTIHLTGDPADQLATPKRTAVVFANGWNPVWGESFALHVRYPELAVLTLRVMDKDITLMDVAVAEASIPITSLETGYRGVPLYNVQQDVPFPDSSLFCHFSWEAGTVQSPRRREAENRRKLSLHSLSRFFSSPLLHLGSSGEVAPSSPSPPPPPPPESAAIASTSSAPVINVTGID
eukprot:NODE_1683_length_910_cov_292.236934_g1174_i0.p1 GENE.NODE_1683_length_910_cov_292.236934_g1174_i0~~NODE_1683_length_910_cov_292.236934_g1174_i0.p1  ORF type:complete len:243 (-),score=23.86 NODE_1683_length_910_cov_292.236934_g1174_i0:57-785(-)